MQKIGFSCLLQHCWCASSTLAFLSHGWISTNNKVCIISLRGFCWENLQSYIEELMWISPGSLSKKKKSKDFTRILRNQEIKKRNRQFHLLVNTYLLSHMCYFKSSCMKIFNHLTSIIEWYLLYLGILLLSQLIKGLHSENSIALENFTTRMVCQCHLRRLYVLKWKANIEPHLSA